MERQYLSQTKKAIAPPQTQSHAIARHSPHPIEELQGAIGNRAVNQLLANQPLVQTKPLFRGLSHELAIQPKLTIGAPGDKYEQEADRVASQVVEQIHAPATAQSTPGHSVQRQEKPEEELQAKPNISDLQRLPLSPAIQPEAIQEEEELQAKSTLQRRESIGGGEASTDLESAINSARGRGEPLEPELQQSMGQAMGADFSGVRVHTDAQSHQLNQSIQAKAFTTGQDVFFRQGAYQPGSHAGQELIAHELTHVVQQAGICHPKSALKNLPASPISQQQNENPILQRLIGFEIETGIPAKKKMRDGTYKDPDYQDFNIDLSDGSKLDVDSDPSADCKILEFASVAVDETMSARKFRKVATTWLNLLTTLRNKALKSPPIRHLDTVIPEAPDYARYGVNTGTPGDMERVSIQATHGFRLDKVRNFLENTKLINSDGSSRVTSKEQAAHEAASSVDLIIKELKTNYDPNKYAKVKDRHVEEVAGFFALIANYMLSGKYVTSGYAKNRSFLFYKSKLSDVRNILVKKNPYAAIVLNDPKSITQAALLLLLVTKRKADEKLWIGSDKPTIEDWINQILSGTDDPAFEAAKNSWGTDIKPSQVKGGVAAVVEHRDIYKVVPQDTELKLSQPKDILDYLTKIYEANKEWEDI